MLNTYTQIYIHIVFAVEGGQNIIPNYIKRKFINTLQALSKIKTKS
jgi:hypothetical protein